MWVIVMDCGGVSSGNCHRQRVCTKEIKCGPSYYCKRGKCCPIV
ncbi:MAG: hypothetical protein ACP5T6_01835 [Candidatus Micrarchaeia archaeon]